MEFKGFSLSRTKTKRIECKYSEIVHEARLDT